VSGSSVRVLEVEGIDATDEDALKSLISRVNDAGVKCAEVKDAGFLRVYDCTEPDEDDFINKVEDLIEE